MTVTLAPAPPGAPLALTVTLAPTQQERLILLMLDSWRNRWLKAEVVATALGTGAGCAALLSSVFGQNNLPKPFLPEDHSLGRFGLRGRDRLRLSIGLAEA